MRSPLRLVRHALRDMDPARIDILERDYCRLLRRAVIIGWSRAKTEYLPSERARGRPVTQIMHDLALFEDLNDLARRSGFDPIEMQRRSDLYRAALRPVTVVAAAILVAVMAGAQVAPLPAVLLGASSCWASLRLTKAILALE